MQPPAAGLSAPPPLAARPFSFDAPPPRAIPFSKAPDAIGARPVSPDAWTTDEAAPSSPVRTPWFAKVRSTVGAPFNALATVIARADGEVRGLRRDSRRGWRRFRAELALLALRFHGIVVHKTRGRLGAILLAVTPVLLLSAAAGLYFATRAPVTKTAVAVVEAVPTEADIARILRSRTGFTVTTEPAGARINVDGRTTGRITPERVSGFAPGLHSIELKKSGYYDTNLAAVLEEGSTLVLPPVILKPLPKEHFDPVDQ